MNFFSSLVVGILRAAFRIWLLVIAVAVIASVLVLGLTVAMFSILWSLLTGRRPAVFTVIRPFQQASQQFREKAWASGSAAGNAGSGVPASEVVDVQAREVPQALSDRSPPKDG
jgi:uncharacterized membrane protein